MLVATAGSSWWAEASAALRHSHGAMETHPIIPEWATPNIVDYGADQSIPMGGGQTNNLNICMTAPPSVNSHPYCATPSAPEQSNTSTYESAILFPSREIMSREFLTVKYVIYLQAQLIKTQTSYVTVLNQLLDLDQLIAAESKRRQQQYHQAAYPMSYQHHTHRPPPHPHSAESSSKQFTKAPPRVHSRKGKNFGI